MATIKDYEEIRAVAQMYIDGDNGDSSIMKPAFHKNAAIRITMEDWHGQNFVDFHILRKDETGWKIVAK